MKAVLLNQHGGPDVLQFGEISDPEPKNNEVRVRLKAASVNHIDIWIRQGIPAYPVTFPHVLGADGAGIIDAVGPDAEGVSPGDRVLIFPAISCGTCSFCRSGKDNQCDAFDILGSKRKGTYAECVLVPDQNVWPLPDDFPFEKAAAFPLAYLTAWHMLRGRARLVAKENVLVIGAGSGVGTAAIQIAKASGARVIALTSDESKGEKIKTAGADEILSLNGSKNFSKKVTDLTKGAGVEVVFEHVGPATWSESVKSLRKYGRLVVCGATTGPTVESDLRTIFSRDLSVLGAKMGTQKEFKELSSLVFEGKINPLIDKMFPLNAAKEAHQYIESRQQVGKVLLTL